MVAEVLGFIASICFTLQYAPQALLNFRIQSCVGFSGPGIIIKLIGAAFLAVNSYVRNEPSSVFLYGCFNVAQHMLFMVQFGIYPSEEGKPPNRRYFLWLLFPLVPVYLATVMPGSVEYTSFFKPVAQVLSHIPQLYECIRLRTTKGVSLSTQHLNFIGGLCGIYLSYQLKVPVSTFLMYLNSLFQAVTIYAVAMWYDNT